jgi:hypothetical protein
MAFALLPEASAEQLKPLLSYIAPRKYIVAVDDNCADDEQQNPNGDSERAVVHHWRSLYSLRHNFNSRSQIRTGTRVA